MTTRSEREKAQKLNEQHQAILARMLREEDNKYCADCEAKGPRWASWNLGVFICIRCAGIHRNLGVHISRVKSVNLDQWTPEQMQCMQEMGNTKARQIYEANLPENFRRPQTDQSVEFFIRDKYEKKKYTDRSFLNGTTKEKDKRKEEKRKEKDPEKSSAKPQPFEKVKSPQKKEEQQSEQKVSPRKAAEPTVDLLGLDGPSEASLVNGSATVTSALNDDLDIFGPMVSNPLPSSTTAHTEASSTLPAVAASSAAPGELDLFTEPATKSDDAVKKPLSKDSILSLYGTGTIPQQNAPAGMFIGPSQIPYPSQAAASFQGFPGMAAPMPAATGIMGNMMGHSMPMMGQGAGMMVGMGLPNGFMANTQATVMGLPQNMMGSQTGMVGNMIAPQNIYGMQQNQQAQWNLAQMNQQMAGMNISGASGMMGFSQPANTVGGWTGSSAGQTLSTQLWK